MRNKRKIIHIVWLLFALYLLFANHIFGTLISVEGEAKLCDIPLPQADTDIKFHLDGHFIRNIDWKPSYRIYGWAFVEGTDAEEQEVFLVMTALKGMRQYIFDSQSMERRDELNAFRSQNLRIKEVGFSSQIPMGMVESGEYRLGLYVEVDGAGSFTETDKIITAANGELATHTATKGEVGSKSEPVDVDLTGVSQAEDIEFWVETVSQEGEFVEIGGWAFIKGKNAEGQKPFVVLTHSDGESYVFAAEAAKRPDVTAHFAESGLDLDDSGYAARIDKSSLKKGEYSIALYIENGEERAVVYSVEKVTIERKKLFGIF